MNGAREELRGEEKGREGLLLGIRWRDKGDQECVESVESRLYILGILRGFDMSEQSCCSSPRKRSNREAPIVSSFFSRNFNQHRFACRLLLTTCEKTITIPQLESMLFFAPQGPSKVDKRNQELPCPHCDRIFKQKQRLDQHIANQHADAAEEQPDAASSSAPAAPAPQPAPARFDVGSRAGFYTQKTPRMMLHEVTAPLGKSPTAPCPSPCAPSLPERRVLHRTAVVPAQQAADTALQGERGERRLVELRGRAG